MVYQNMPSFGYRQAVINEQHFFKSGVLPDGVLPSDQGIKDAWENALIIINDDTWPKKSPIVSINIEKWLLWPWADRDKHRVNAARYADVAQRLKEHSDASLCYYSILPFGGVAVASRASREAPYREEWVSTNKETSKLFAGALGALCPQMYSFYGGKDETTRAAYLDQWKQFARDTVALARELHPDLPIYPYVWPQFHPGGSEKDYDFVPADRWEAQLRLLKEITDGVILWGGTDFHNEGHLQWDDDAPWWQATKRVFPELNKQVNQ